MRRTGVWVSAFRNSVIHKIFSEFLQPLRYVRIQRVVPFLIEVFVFVWIGISSQQLLFWSSRRIQVSPFLPFNMFTWHSYGIGIYPTQVSSCLSSHTVAWHSWRCHGWWSRRAWEDVGWSIKVSLMLKNENWRKNSLTSQEPRSERSCLCCTVAESRFWWDVFLDHWPIHKNIRFHHKAFRTTILLVCFRGLS